jgi:hypothetical protein
MLQLVIGVLEVDDLCLQLDELLVLLLERVHLQLRLQVHDRLLQRTDLLVLRLACQFLLFCSQ